jgi:hypothetical protein
MNPDINSTTELVVRNRSKLEQKMPLPLYQLFRDHFTRNKLVSTQKRIAVMNEPAKPTVTRSV